jgi:hypothetical protein
VIVNIAHGLFPSKPMSPEVTAEIADHLNLLGKEFVGFGRTYQGGLEKFEPGEMEALPLSQVSVDWLDEVSSNRRSGTTAA